MGGGGSQTVNQNINTKVLTNITNSSMNKIQETNENRLTNVQSLNVELHDIVNCPVSMEQTIESKFVATTESMIKAVQASQTELTNELKAQASAALDKATQAGNFQFGDRQNANININNEIEAIVSNQLSTETLKKTINSSSNMQDGVLKMYGYTCESASEAQGLMISQNIRASFAAAAITRSLTEALSHSKVVNDISASADADLTSENTGVADIVDSIGNIFMGPMKYAMMISAVCCGLCVILLIVLGMSGGGQQAIAKGQVPNMIKAANAATRGRGPAPGTGKYGEFGKFGKYGKFAKK
tara:strand:- start:256 stop:1158 length:903 start_codon:yes stop_codon:yes gene_type:complete